jgi:predicted NBD/HSP70 family sugar kinase
MHEAGLSRQDIVRKLELSLPTVTYNMSDLETEGLISTNGSAENHSEGRRAKTYKFVKNARFAIGLDISKEYVIAAAVNLAGEVICKIRSRVNFERSDDYYRRLGHIVRKTITKSGLDKKLLLGVGLGVPGLVTEDRQTVFYGKILKFTGATCAEFSQYIPYKTALFNDASAAGFGEFWSREDVANAFYINLSNNIGGAFAINNKIVGGNHFHSGEVGHLKIHPGGKHCYCGQRGCVDPYLAATTLSDLSENDLAAFFKLLKAKDEKALAAWNSYLDDLALTLNNVEELFDCRVILGGYISRYLGPWMSELKRRTAALNSFEKDAAYIQISRYKMLSIAAGSAMTFLSDFITHV